MSSVPVTDFGGVSTAALQGEGATSALHRVAAERRRRPLTALFGLFILAMVLVTGSRWGSRTLVSELLFLAGLALVTIAILGRTWANLFIAGYKTRLLIRTGPYSLCRNPLYLFSAIGMTGIGLCTGTLTIPATMCLFFAAYYPFIIRCEELRLSETHGEDFDDYCQTVPAFWPASLKIDEPETYVIQPRILRRNIADGFWFIALAALAHTAAHLHQFQLLPELFLVW